MQSYREYFSGKRVTLMGLGLLGRGVGDAKFLAPLCAELIVTDLKSEAELADSLSQLKDFKNITFHLGAHKLDDFQNRDLIIKAAGVPLDSPFVAEAKKNNIPVRMSADLFMELSGVLTVGITGTRGKSTVTHMVAHILKQAGKHVLLGGNVRGVSTLALLPEAKPDSVAVLELDSWQCQGLAEGKLGPHVAVFTTFMADHMNYYHDDMAAYFADKANIFLYQKSDDILILGEQVVPLIKQYGYQDKVIAHAQIAGAKDIPADWQLKIPGEHNRYNAGIAVAVARGLDIDDDITKEAIESFEGLPGRLQFIREVNGTKIYNDNNATTLDATIAAIHSVKQPVALIVGGVNKLKGFDLGPLAQEINTKVSRVVLLTGENTTGSDALEPLIKVDYIKVGNLAQAVAEALSGSPATVLFSPAFASFGMFKNEYDRNDQFLEAVQKAA